MLGFSMSYSLFEGERALDVQGLGPWGLIRLWGLGLRASVRLIHDLWLYLWDILGIVASRASSDWLDTE